MAETASEEAKNGDEQSPASVATGPPSTSQNMQQGITVYCRLRPVAKPSKFYSLDFENNEIEFNIPIKSQTGGAKDFKIAKNSFKFHGIIDREASQAEVFDVFAKDCVQSVLQGFNSTIFAYGQTGSGKTYSIIGGTNTYEERGIIPRSLSHLFSQYENRPDAQFETRVSFMEIYNEKCRDLLDPEFKKDKKNQKRVFPIENELGEVEVKNLGQHPVSTEEDALNLLFLGDHNRVMASTAMNTLSSRSHCIFTVHIEMRQPGSDTVRRAKLHLVDLAGSERVAKSLSTGDRFNEAKHINGSLHFLQMVIVRLQEKAKGKKVVHVPYRNSMMTMVLKDSLGGNCRTRMLATLNVDTRHLSETIGTCRFARYVAMVKNDAKVNEQMDPKLALLKEREMNAALREELRLLKEGADDEEEVLTQQWLRRMRDKVTAYLADHNPEANLSLGKITALRVRATFRIFKAIAAEVAQDSGGGGGGGTQVAGAGAGESRKTQELQQRCDELWKENQRMKKLLSQRERDIAILKQLESGNRLSRPARPAAPEEPAPKPKRVIKKRRKKKKTRRSSSHQRKHSNSSSHKSRAVRNDDSDDDDDDDDDDDEDSDEDSDEVREKKREARTHRRHRSNSRHREEKSAPPPVPTPALNISLISEPKIGVEILADRKAAFKAFCKFHEYTSAIKQNQATLQKKVKEAKELATDINAARKRIEALSKEMEKIRFRDKMAAAEAGTPVEEQENLPLSSEAERHLQGIEGEKLRYKNGYNKLKSLKKAIPKIKSLIQNGVTKVRADFDEWYKAQMASSTTSDLSTTQQSNSRARPRTGSSRPPTAGAANRPPTHRDDTQRSHTAPQPASGPDPVGEDMRLFYEARNQLLSMKKNHGGGSKDQIK